MSRLTRFQQVAAKVAAEKAEHPERFCPKAKCLWRTKLGGYCPRHTPPLPIVPLEPPKT